MEELPLVSVLIPCYNHEKFVEQCILSVVNQTYKNIQLIVIDDGSKDNSFEIIERLSKQYGFFCKRQENKGLTNTLNVNITEYVKGKYLCLLASDDYFALDKIELQVDYLEKTDFVAVVTPTYTISSEGDETGILSVNLSNEALTFESLLEHNIIPALTVMYETRLFYELNGYNPNLVIEDWDFWLKITNKYKIGFLLKPLAYYRDHDNNSSKNKLKMAQSIIQILLEWKHHPEFSRLYKKQILWNARLLGKNHKLEAWRTLISHPKYMFDVRYWKAFFKLIFIW